MSASFARVKRPPAAAESTGSSTITSTPSVTAASTCCCCLEVSWSALLYLISQSGHSGSTLASNSGRSWDSYRAVFDSGSRKAIVPPPSPPPSSSSPPHAASPRARPSTAIGTSTRGSLTLMRSSSRYASGSRLRVFPSPFPTSCGLARRQRRGQETIRLVHDEGERAEQLGALAQHPWDDLELLDRVGDRVAAHRAPHGIEQHVAGRAEIAAHDHALRVQQVAEVGDGDSHCTPRVADQPLRRGVAGGRQLQQPPGGDLLTAAGAQQVGDRARGRERLEAAPVSAPAHRPAVGEHGVADLPGGSPDAVVKPARGDEASADTGGELDVGEVGPPLAGAPHELGEGAEVGVVLDLDRHLEPPAGFRRGVAP